MTSVRAFLRSRAELIVVCVLGALVRLYVAFFAGLQWTGGDTESYYRQAEAILAGDPISMFPNGYPLLLAGLKRLAPDALVPPLNVGLNVLLSVAIVGMVYRLGREIGGRWSGGLAGFAVALYPNQLNYVRFLLSEVPATFFVVLALLLYVRRRLLWSGLTTALATLTRTSLAPMGLLLVCIEWGFGTSRSSVARYLAGVAVAAVGYGALLGAGVVAPSSNLGGNLLISINSYSHTGIIEYRTYEEKHTREELSHPLRTYVRFVRDHPGAYLAQRASSLWALWGPWPHAGRSETRSAAERALIGLRFPLLLLAIGGVIVHRRRREAWAMFTPVIAVTGVHLFFFSNARFTYPAEPGALVLAALFLVSMLRPQFSTRFLTEPAGEC